MLLGAAIIAVRVARKSPRGASATAETPLEEEEAELAPYLERVRREAYGVPSGEEAT